jgi:hypothetical protein
VFPEIKCHKKEAANHAMAIVRAVSARIMKPFSEMIDFSDVDFKLCIKSFSSTGLNILARG